MIRAGLRGGRAGGGLVGGGAIVVALALAGCGSSSNKTAVTTPPTSASATSTGSGSTGSGTTTSGSTSSGSGSGATTVTVTDTEFHEAFSTLTFHPGAYTFVTVNRGKVPHALTVEGQGIDVSTPTIEPGQSASINVTLKSGSYDLFCPVPGHKALGMNQEITVGTGSSGGSSSATTAPASPTSSVPGGNGVSY